LLAREAARSRTSIDRLDSTDKVSEDILIEIVEDLEKHLWMFQAQQAW
jgi:DNA-binding ferritin-like protein